MFCSFARAPRIMRFFCKGSVVEWDDGRFEGLLRKMGKKRIEGARAVILLDVLKVGFWYLEDFALWKDLVHIV